MDVDITWLLSHSPVSSSKNANDRGNGKPFSIDRSNAQTCRTPRRNVETAAALRFWKSFASWSDGVRLYFVQSVFPVQLNTDGLNVASASDDGGVFVPI